MVWLLAAVLTSNVTFASGTEDINDESVAYQSIETNLSEEKQLLDVDQANVRRNISTRTELFV